MTYLSYNDWIDKYEMNLYELFLKIENYSKNIQDKHNIFFLDKITFEDFGILIYNNSSKLDVWIS
jgi:hypothetical protein